MLIETLIRILLIVIIAIIINIVIGKIPNDSNTRSLIRRWGRIITGVITVITILTFIFPWISSPFYNDDSKESFNESSYSEIVTTTSSTSNRITTPSTTKTTTTTNTTTEVPTEKSGNTYIDAISLTIGETSEKSITYSDDNDNCVWYIVNISERKNAWRYPRCG